jgi:hypothetical protein
MTKDELKNRIKNLVKQVYPKTSKIDLNNPPSTISLDNTRFPVLVKFPTLKDTIIKILTNQYDLFIKDIEWVAPRPTTFRIILANDQPFYLIFTDRSWIAKVEGKKYYLLNLSEEQNAVESIARILSYGTKSTPEKEVPTETPIEDVPPLETAAPETPPTEEEPIEEPPAI